MVGKKQGITGRVVVHNGVFSIHRSGIRFAARKPVVNVAAPTIPNQGIGYEESAS